MTPKAHETANQHNDSELVGVINPYALAELVSGRTIKWADGADSRRMLEEVLGMPYEQLFDPIHDSPLYLGVRLKEDLTLERARPAVLDVDLPRNGNDLDRYLFHDTRSLRKVGDLGPYFDTNDITELSIDWAELVEPGVLRLRITRATESRLAQLARVFTPRIVTSVVHVPDFQPVDDIVLEPPVSYWGDYGSFFAEAAEFFDPIQGTVPNCYLIAAMSAVA